MPKRDKHFDHVAVNNASDVKPEIQNSVVMAQFLFDKYWKFGSVNSSLKSEKMVMFEKEFLQFFHVHSYCFRAGSSG